VVGYFANGAARIPKIEHQMVAMSQLFSTFGIVLTYCFQRNKLQRTHYSTTHFIPIVPTSYYRYKIGWIKINRTNGHSQRNYEEEPAKTSRNSLKIRPVAPQMRYFP
jgi:hypothetical protein